MRVRLVISLFLVSIAPHDASSTSSSNLRVTGGSTESRKKRTRWEPLEAAASLHSQRHEPLLAPPITTISTNRRACSVYLWDALSAAKYHLCRRLLRDCVYEGMGGRRVRVWGYPFPLGSMVHSRQASHASCMFLALPSVVSFLFFIVCTHWTRYPLAAPLSVETTQSW